MMKYLLVVMVAVHVLVMMGEAVQPSKIGEAFIAILDVGQGDALLIHTKAGYNILIDTGPDAQVLSALEQSLPPFDRTIDLLFLTHPHADHINGALYILNRYHVGGVVMSNVAYTTPQVALLKKMIQEKNILLFEPQASVDWYIDPNLTLDVLFPFSSLAQKTFKNINDASLVMMLNNHDYKMLLTGDMEEDLEMILAIYYGQSLRAAGLKVGHHGSKTSSSELLLNLVEPQEMFISVGKNNLFHHPDPHTLERLQKWGVINRTDKAGTIQKILL